VEKSLPASHTEFLTLPEMPPHRQVSFSQAPFVAFFFARNKYRRAWWVLMAICSPFQSAAPTCRRPASADFSADFTVAALSYRRLQCPNRSNPAASRSPDMRRMLTALRRQFPTLPSRVFDAAAATTRRPGNTRSQGFLRMVPVNQRLLVYPRVGQALHPGLVLRPLSTGLGNVHVGIRISENQHQVGQGR
jgi:hypothetical protein